MKPYVRCYYNLARYAIKLYRVKNVHFSLLVKELNHSLKPYGFRLSESQKQRIKSYLIQSCITNEWFSLLRGYGIAKNEWKASLYIGAITPIVDDLMDNDNYNGQNIKAIYKGEAKANTADEHVLYYGYQRLLTCVKNPDYFIEVTDKIADAQDKSRNQKQKDISLTELESYTRNKGGLATLFYRSILDNTPSALEQESIMILGESLQWVNDVFGLYEDYHQGIKTPAIAIADFSIYNRLFHQKLEQLKLAIAKLSYPMKNKNNALISMVLVLKRGEVCMLQLRKLQKDKNQLEIEKYERKDLLCDMEKVSNFYKSIQLSLKFNYFDA